MYIHTTCTIIYICMYILYLTYVHSMYMLHRICKRYSMSIWANAWVDVALTLRSINQFIFGVSVFLKDSCQIIILNIIPFYFSRNFALLLFAHFCYLYQFNNSDSKCSTFFSLNSLFYVLHFLNAFSFLTLAVSCFVIYIIFIMFFMFAYYSTNTGNNTSSIPH